MGEEVTFAMSVPAVDKGDEQSTFALEVPFDATLAAVEFDPAGVIRGASGNSRKIALVREGDELARHSFTRGSVRPGSAKALSLGKADDRVLAAGEHLHWVSSPSGAGMPDPGGTIRFTLAIPEDDEDTGAAPDQAVSGTNTGQSEPVTT